MLTLPRLALLLICVGLGASPAAAHYNMLLPETASAKRGAAVTFIYQWGHPFEHQLFNAPAPDFTAAVSPPDDDDVDGGKGHESELDRGEKVSVTGVEGKPVTAYRYKFTPQERGDYRMILRTPPIWMEEEQAFYQDIVKVVLHVQAQKGWDAWAGQKFEWVPLTRPYGLEPGVAFQAQLFINGKPIPNAQGHGLPRRMVEIEHYNVTAPKKLPPDEHITRTAKTDPNGVATCTLTEPGWWCITAQRRIDSKDHEGKAYPVRERTTLWVWVDDKATAKGQ